MSPALTFDEQLKYLGLTHALQHHAALTSEGAAHHWSHAEFLRRLIEAETHERQQRAHAHLRVQLHREPPWSPAWPGVCP